MTSAEEAPAGILGRFRLDGRVALVSGAGRGIGAACALALAEAGADVAITARGEQRLAQVAARVEKLGRRVVVLPADLSDPAAAGPLVAGAVDGLGRLDVVVNTVGGARPRPFLDTTTRHLEDAFRFNVSSAFAMSRAAVPHLLAAGGGSIVNVTSGAGRYAGRGIAAYGTVKAALAHLTRLLAADLAPRIRVNAVAPGAIATDALRIVLDTPALREQMEARTPLHRIGTPEDVAAAVLYLVSPAGGYVTGKILEVDGGIEGSNLDLRLPDL